MKTKVPGTSMFQWILLNVHRQKCV